MHELFYEFRHKTNSKNAETFLKFASIKMSRGFKFVQESTILQVEDYLWWDERIGRITGSLIYETTQCRSPNNHNLVNRILGHYNIYGSEELERRVRILPDVVDVVGMELRKSLLPCGLLLDPECPVIGASPDAVGPDFVVEIKCPRGRRSVDQFVDSNGLLKKKYYAQIQLQMYLSGMPFGYFVIADSDFEITGKVDYMLKVGYDRSYARKMVKDATKFWKLNVYPELLKEVAME